MDSEPIGGIFPPSLRPGDFFADRFEVIAEIGIGGMCEVYRVRDTVLDRLLALKILQAHLAADPLQNERFRKEAHTCSLLQHPSIISILSYGTARDGRPYLAMELLEGRTLEQRFRDGGRLSRAEFEAIFMQVLNALVYAHGQGVVHRDLKPANIMILEQESERVKLLDFGIAKILETGGQDRQSTIGIMGSPYYMSPEQCSGGKVDRRTDIYSLACVMYEALAGSPPFKGDTALETMYGHMSKKVPKIEDFSGALKLPGSLSQAIARALSKKPEERQQSVEEFEREITEALSKTNIFQTRRSKWWLATAIALVCLSAIASLKFIRDRQSKGFSPPVQTRSALRRISAASSVDSPAVVAEINVLRQQKQFDLAIKKCRDAIKVGERYRQDRPELLFQEYLALGDVYKDMHRQGDAAVAFRAAVDVYPFAQSEGRLHALGYLCKALDDDGREDEALETIRKGIAAAEKCIGEDQDHHLADCYMQMAALLKKKGRLKEAVSVAFKGMQFYWNRPDLFHSEEFVNYSWSMFELFKQAGNESEGRNVIERCRAALQEPGQRPSGNYQAPCVKPAVWPVLRYVKHALDNGLVAEAESMLPLARQHAPG